MQKRHIALLRLPQPYLKPPHQRRRHQVQLRARELDAQALPTASAKRHLELVAPLAARGAEPALRVEGPRVREDAFGRVCA